MRSGFAWTYQQPLTATPPNPDFKDTGLKLLPLPPLFGLRRPKPLLFSFSLLQTFSSKLAFCERQRGDLRFYRPPLFNRFIAERHFFSFFYFWNIQNIKLIDPKYIWIFLHPNYIILNSILTSIHSFIATTCFSIGTNIEGANRKKTRKKCNVFARIICIVVDKSQRVVSRIAVLIRETDYESP